MGKAAFSYRSLPHWGRGTASAVDRVLSQTAHLRRSFPLFFIPLEPYPARSARHLPLEGKALCRGYGIPIQPPPLRGTSFQQKEGVSTRAPSLGRGCRAPRGGVGFLLGGKAASSLPSPLGKGDRASGARVLSQMAYLRRSFPLFFIPLVPYPARSARHLPLEGKALFRRYSFSTHACIRSDNARIAASSFRSLPKV